MFEDYRLWIELQTTAGGLPANVFGYMSMLLVRMFAFYDLRNPAAVLPSIPALGKYLSSKDIPERNAQRPTMYRWPVPQRQVDGHPSVSEYALVRDHLAKFLSGRVLSDGSNAIRKGQAADSLDAYYWDKFELFHIHPVDKSFHVHLDPSDAKLLIERGWAEWFGLAGKVGKPHGTVFVYAVRGEEELDVLDKIWEAAEAFAKGEKHD
jgi:hypothetical protein